MNWHLITAKYDSINHTSIIPDNIFSMKIDGIIIPKPYKSKNDNNPTYIYEIFWSTGYVYGSGLLTINKRQIVLTTGDKERNPEFLYWFANITLAQYQTIIQKIENFKYLRRFDDGHYRFNRSFSYEKIAYEMSVPFAWPNRMESVHSDNFLKPMYNNTMTMIDLFNQGLKPHDQIHFISFNDFKKVKPLKAAWSADKLIALERLLQ